MNTKGYIEENSSRPMELIHFREHAKLQLKQYAGVVNDQTLIKLHRIKATMLKY
jgi:hypothetical protein